MWVSEFKCQLGMFDNLNKIPNTNAKKNLVVVGHICNPGIPAMVREKDKTEESQTTLRGRQH